MSISALVKVELFPPQMRTVCMTLLCGVRSTADISPFWFNIIHAESGLFLFATALVEVATGAFMMMSGTSAQGCSSKAG